MAKIFSKSKVILLIILLIASFLRFYKLTVNPVSMFGDELDLGYQAYSILKSGQDYYGNSMPIHFHSLAEWRTPLYLYAAVPTVAIWGITPLGVRVPAAIFGVLGVLAMYLFVKEFLSHGGKSVNFHPRALIAASLLAISPWHLQYSRAGFEVTMMLFFLLTGFWLFFRSLNKKDGKYLWLSVACLVLTPWIYSTAKFFMPFFLVFMFLLYRKEILNLGKKNLIYSMMAGLIIGVPIAVSTLFGGGAERFSYISVFTDPVTESEVGEARLQDARMRGEATVGATPLFFDRAFHNKFTFWGSTIIHNVLQPFSTEFLFIKGDPNPRQSVGVGEFYKINMVFMLLGLTLFLTKFKNSKTKVFMIFWILFGVVPAAITRDGGNHATRLILILPPLILLISYGLVGIWKVLSKKMKMPFVILYVSILTMCFATYEHVYWFHYPFTSERWWHAGFEETFSYTKSVDSQYGRIFFSMEGEPIPIFFAGYYEYSPDKWHQGFPFEATWIDGFGRISYIDKYYFGSPNQDGGSIYDLPKYITSNDLYVAVAKEVGWNLILDPARVPSGLKLLRAIAYPSGEPAYYVFTKQ